jgi:hypothetical protein
MDRIYLVQDREGIVAGCYENDKEPLGSTKCWVFLGR